MNDEQFRAEVRGWLTARTMRCVISSSVWLNSVWTLATT